MCWVEKKPFSQFGLILATLPSEETNIAKTPSQLRRVDIANVHLPPESAGTQAEEKKERCPALIKHRIQKRQVKDRAEYYKGSQFHLPSASCKRLQVSRVLKQAVNPIVTPYILEAPDAYREFDKGSKEFLREFADSSSDSMMWQLLRRNEGLRRDLQKLEEASKNVADTVNKMKELESRIKAKEALTERLKTRWDQIDTNLQTLLPELEEKHRRLLDSSQALLLNSEILMKQSEAFKNAVLLCLGAMRPLAEDGWPQLKELLDCIDSRCSKFDPTIERCIDRLRLLYGSHKTADCPRRVFIRGHDPFSLISTETPFHS